MACGLPVVADFRRRLTELVEPDVGELAPRSDVQPLADAIDGLFTRDIPAMGRAARLRAERSYSWDAAFAQLLRSYAGLRGEQAASWAVPVCAQS